MAVRETGAATEFGRLVAKTETKLRRLEKARLKSLQLHERSWGAKRQAIIDQLPADVRDVLAKTGVIEPGESASV